jgi:protocatechuate 3,4-dioxygenase beta subunit
MHVENEGLARDLDTLTRRMVRRRQVLRWALGGSLISLIGCSSDSNGDDTGTGGSGGAGGSGGIGGSGGTAGTGGGPAGSCSTIPEETEGPFPGDGTNENAAGVANALVLAGVVRRDITRSFAGATGVATGVPLTIRLVLVNAADGCAPLEGFAIYLWHCDRAGNYSMYSAAAADENYCRGVQETDADGVVEFQTIFPACYPGRWPHAHFEIFPALDSISSATNKVATSQLALPGADCVAVFSTAGYEGSISNLAQLSLQTDGIFRDGSSLQLATVTGNVTDGYVATLTVAIEV